MCDNNDDFASMTSDAHNDCSVNVFDLVPNEILETICGQRCVHYEDLSRLGRVSQRFRELVDRNADLWRLKFRQQWPHLWSHMCPTRDHHSDGSGQSTAHSVADWHGLVVDRHVIGRRVRLEVSRLSADHYLDEELSNESFKAFLDYDLMMSGRHCPELSVHLIDLFQINELEVLLNDGFDRKNLTDKYYTLKVLRFLRHESLKRRWTQYMASDVESRDHFHGSLMISSWFQLNRTVDECHYRRQIELMSLLTIDEIALKYGSNALIRENGGKCLPDSEANALTESKWSPKDCKQILFSLNEVLFIQLGFVSNDEDYYDMNNSFMDKVIDNRLGIPITYCILYQTIAAKLGVKLFGVNFPNNFILKWKQFDESESTNRWAYIDVYRSGQLLSPTSALFQDHSSADIECMGVCSARDLFSRMCRNLVEIGRQQEISSEGLICLRNALELLCILAPDDNEPQLLLSRVYLHLNINLEEVNEMLQKISERDPNSIGVVMFLRQSVASQLSAKRNTSANSRKTCVKRRKDNSDIKYAIGMIMSHIKYNYRCVIYGWDSKCAASRDWIYQMGVYNLPNKDKQPFYNVLVEDGSSRYAAQENLQPSDEPLEIKHPEVGKYFKEFAETHYIPNEQKADEYPDDESAVDSILKT